MMMATVRPFASLALIAAIAAASAFAAPPEAPEAPEHVSRILFASCADQNRPQPIWSVARGAKPDLALLLGDNVYGDDETQGLPNLEAAYETAAKIPRRAAFLAETHALAVWDDHDYGRNDGGADYPHRERAQALFLEHWNVPGDDPRRTRPGLYAARTFGPPGRRVQVILLDTRFFRSPLKPTDESGVPGRERYRPDPDPAKTMLGRAQWAWLEERLAEPADLRILASSIQVIADGHGWERWGNLPAERARLYGLLANAGENTILLLSGDRHVAGFYEDVIRAPRGSVRLVEATSSGVNNAYPSRGEAGPKRVGAKTTEATLDGLVNRDNIGLLDVDWAARTVTFRILDEAGADALTPFTVEF